MIRLLCVQHKSTKSSKAKKEIDMDYEKALKQIKWELVLHHSSSYMLGEETISYIMKDYFVNAEDVYIRSYFSNFCYSFIAETISSQFQRMSNFKSPKFNRAEREFFKQFDRVENNPEQVGLLHSVNQLKKNHNYICLQILMDDNFDTTDMSERQMTYGDVFISKDKS